MQRRTALAALAAATWACAHPAEGDPDPAGDVDILRNAFETLHPGLLRYCTPADLAPYLDTWDPSFRDWGDQVERFDDRFFRFKEDAPDAMATIAPSARTSRGGCSRRSVRSTVRRRSSSRRDCRRAGGGLLVGEPTGGNLRGINGGAFFFLRLPAMGLEIDLPVIGQLPTGVLPADRWLVPDVVARPTVTDLAEGRDVVVEAVRAMVRAKV